MELFFKFNPITTSPAEMEQVSSKFNLITTKLKSREEMECAADEFASILNECFKKTPQVAMSACYAVPTTHDGLNMAIRLTDFCRLVGLRRIGEEPQGRVYFNKERTEFIFHIVFGDTEEEMKEFDEFIGVGPFPNKMTDSQYETLCKNCDLMLDEDVAIECCVNANGDEMTLCSNCWYDHETEWKKEGWRTTTMEDEED
jgi:hypothetical protein